MIAWPLEGAEQRRQGCLQIQDQLQSGIDVGHELGRDSPNPLREIVFVQGHDLRDVGHGVLGEAAAPGREKDVARASAAWR